MGGKQHRGLILCLSKSAQQLKCCQHITCPKIFPISTVFFMSKQFYVKTQQENCIHSNINKMMAELWNATSANTKQSSSRSHTNVIWRQDINYRYWSRLRPNQPCNKTAEIELPYRHRRELNLSTHHIWKIYISHFVTRFIHIM